MRGLMAWALAGLMSAADPGLAQSPWWTGGADDAIVSGVCLDRQFPYAGSQAGYSPCLRLYCFPETGPVTLELAPDGYRLPGSAQGTIAVDGRAVVALTFTADPRYRSPAVAAYDPAAHAALLPALMAGRQMSVHFDSADYQRLAPAAFPLTGAAAALREWAAVCQTMQPTAPADATPATAPARFLPLDEMGTADAAAEALARRLLAGPIAAAEAATGQRIEVQPTLVTFTDGRRMLRVALCHGSYFGITGCESHYLVAPPGAQGFLPALELIGAGPVWLDAELGVQGWPDLIFGRSRLSQPADYARWRWTGARYDLVGTM